MGRWGRVGGGAGKEMGMGMVGWLVVWLGMLFFPLFFLATLMFGG